MAQSMVSNQGFWAGNTIRRHVQEGASGTFGRKKDALAVYENTFFRPGFAKPLLRN